jgi:hypothetical protein
VQVLDTAAGGIHAIMRLKIRHATPYIYDFPFFCGMRTPFLTDLRGRFLRDLRRSAPDAIVFTRYAWPTGQYDRVQSFPEFAHWMDENYAIGVERGSYRIYVRKAVNDRPVRLRESGGGAALAPHA